MQANTLIDLIESDLFAKRTPMYVGENSLQAIESFVLGFEFAVDQSDTKNESYSSPFKGFNDWVASQLDCYESTSGWKNMIRSSTAQNGEDEVSVFLVLYRQFRGEERE